MNNKNGLRKIRVLLVSRDHPPFAEGGMGVCSGRIQQLLPEFGIEVTTVAGDPHAAACRRECKKGTTIYWVPLPGPNFLTKIPPFAFFAGRLISRLQRDFDLIYSLSTPFWAKVTRPLIVHFQGSRYGEYLACKEVNRKVLAFLNKLYVPFERRLLRSADGVIIPSNNMLDELNSMAGIKKEYAVIPNGVDISMFKPASSRVFKAASKRVLFAGRLDARKGIETLFYAFNEAGKAAGAKLTVAGHGPEKSRLMRLARSLDIQADFIGKVSQEDLAQIYNAADLLVMPSLYEPFGMVALEAMACGTPVIVSSACPDLGMPRFKKQDAHGLGKLMLAALSSEERLKELSDKALGISAGYSWGQVIPELAKYIKKFT
ncbi:MAG: glycosyltransferase family 4 protein [Candidatus Omnitrophica bacterium]|nr:glycosyltransferase family 4 protein [Candidatus Omnitrophota bacterium]